MRIAAALGVALGTLVGASSAQAAHLVRTVKANLDRDAHREHVQLWRGSIPNPYGGTERVRVRWVSVADRVSGTRVRTRVSPRLEHIERRSGLQVRQVSGDARREIVYRGWNGGAGAVPLYAGVLRWTGSRAVREWRYRPPRHAWKHLGRTFYYRGASVTLHRDPQRSSGTLEIRLWEGAGLASEPDCCPSFTRSSLFRYRPATRRYALAKRTWVRNEEHPGGRT